MSIMKWFFKHFSYPAHDNNRDDTVSLGEGSIQLLLISFLVIIMSVFIAGYYWGKKSAVEQLMESLDQEAFADKIYTSMCSWDESANEAKDKTSEVESDVEEEDEAKGALYSAQLAGFGSQKAAESYQLRLHHKGIAAQVMERISFTAGGKQKKWYQVVTQALEKSAIEDIVRRLEQEDKLTSVQITEERQAS
jgi:hypothetical protein